MLFFYKCNRRVKQVNCWKDMFIVIKMLGEVEKIIGDKGTVAESKMSFVWDIIL